MEWKSWFRFKLKLLSVSSFVPVYLLPLLLLLLPCPTHSVNEISKREAQIIRLIEDQALALDSRKFFYDPVMMQTSTHSVYTDPKKKAGQDIIFRKPNSDTGKEAIALSSVENKWAIPTPRGGKKRQFVLLRRAPNGVSVGTSGNEKIPYFSSFVYVTNFLPNTSNEAKTFDIAGVKSIVEWDVWETRPRGFYSGWDTCEFTFLFTCESLQDMMLTASEEVDADAKKARRRKRDTKPAAKKKRETPPIKSFILAPLTPIKSEPGFDPNEYNDLFLDLDIVRPENKGTKKKTSHIHLSHVKPKQSDARRKRFLMGKSKSKQPSSSHNMGRTFGASAQGSASVSAQGNGNGHADGNGQANGQADVQAGGGGSAGGAGGLLGGFLGGGKGRFDKGPNLLKTLNGDGNLKAGLMQGLLGGVTGGLSGDLLKGDILGGLTGDLLGDTLGGGLDMAGLLGGGGGGDLLGSLTSSLGGIADPMSLFENLGADGVLGGLTDLSINGGLGGEGGGGPFGLLSGLLSSDGGGALSALGGGGNALTGLLGGGAGLDILGGLGGGGGGGGDLLGGLAGGDLLGGLSGGGDLVGGLTGALGGLGGGDILGSLGGLGGLAGGLGGLGDILGGITGGGDALGGLGGLFNGGLSVDGLTGLLGSLGAPADILGSLSGGGLEGVASLQGLMGEGNPLAGLTGLLQAEGGISAVSGLLNSGVGIEALTGIINGGGGVEALGGLGGLLGGLGGIASLTSVLGEADLLSLTSALGADGLASLTTSVGAEGIGSLTGMLGVDGVASLSANLGPEGLASLGGLMNQGLPLAALTGLLGGDGGLSALTNLGGVLGGEGGLSATVGATKKVMPQGRSLGLPTDGLANLNVGKLLGGKADGGFLSSLSQGIVGSAGEIIGGPVASAIGSTLDKVVGGGLGDVDISSVTGAISGITDGSIGPISLVGTLISGGLGSGGAIKSLLAGDLFDTVNTKFHTLASGLSGNILLFFNKQAFADVGGSIGGVIGGIMEGDGEAGPESSMKMAQGILGPIATSMDPLNAITAASLSIAQSFPSLGKGMGQSITKVLPNLQESMGLGGLVQTMGIGSIIGSVNGLADSIITAGESLVSSVDVMGNGLIEGVSSVMVNMGVSSEFARLAATGAKLAWSAELMKYTGTALGVRLGADMIGSTLNGGSFRGSGAGLAQSDSLKNWQSMVNSEGEPSNAMTVYGFTYPGAGDNRDFFYIDRCLVRSVFKPDASEEKISGYHLAGAEPGMYDMFYADDPSKAVALIGVSGTLIPEGYKQPHRDANNGVKGTIDKYNIFAPKTPAKYTVVQADDPHAKEIYWMPPDTSRKLSYRPRKNYQGKPLIYGYLFQGIRQSPHIFIAEGDSLAGFFVPDDPHYPEIKETPHGIFIPDHIAGHGRFVLEDKTEYENVKEVRGAFFPDAMNLAGAFGGRLSKSRTDLGTFNFVMDRLAVEFVYVKGHPAMKHIWAAFLSREEWNYRPPSIPSPEETRAEKAPEKKAEGGLNINVNIKANKQHFGIRIESQLTEAFLPSELEIDGLFLPVDSKNRKRPPMWGSITVGRINTAWTFTVSKKHPKHVKITSPISSLFVPNGYPSDDSLIGTIMLDDAQERGEILFTQKQKQTEYFYKKGDEIWLPPKFSDAQTETEQTSTTIPGTTTEPTAPPERPPNYYFGPEHDNSSEEHHDDSLLRLPHIYQFGYYYFDSGSPSPLFIPEVGAQGVFIADDGTKTEGLFFPEKLSLGWNKMSSLFLPKGAMPADGTTGVFYSHLNSGEDSKEHFRCSISRQDKTLKSAEGNEIIPGWELADTITPKPDGSLDSARTTATRKPATYRLINVGGGFKGVVLSGPSELDDPNNPIFQRFLHYKANRDGDVNPWGNVIILDPIHREPAGGPTKLGIGHMAPVQKSAPTVLEMLMDKFSLVNWAWPLAKQGRPETKKEKMRLGNRASNIVDMMDYRMWLLTKYDCKFVKQEDRVIKFLTPKSGDGYLDPIVPAQPKQEWFAKLAEGRHGMFMLDTEGILGIFSRMFNIAVDDLIPYLSPNAAHHPWKENGTRAIPEFAKMAQFDEWGDTMSCEQIEVDELTLAQAMEDHNIRGVDLGMKLVQNVGSPMAYPRMASLLLGKIKEKQEAPPGSGLDLLGSTDLTGNVRLKLKSIVKEKKEAKTGSGEEDRRRKKRSVDKNLERTTAKNIPGWKTQFRSPLKDNKTLSDTGVIFYGLGNCQQKRPPPIALHSSKDPNKLIDYFLKVLRIDCLKNAKDRVMELFNEDFIQFSETMAYFEMSKSNTIINEQRLFPEEIRKISEAFEFTAFSKIYHTLRTRGAPTSGYLEEPNCIITRSISFLTELALYYIMKSRKIAPMHSVRLTRNLLKTLRTVLTKLHHDTLALEEECPDKCDLDKRLTDGDKFRTMSLIQFIIHGMGPFNKGEKLKPAFYTFVGNNKVAIQERVEEFARQYPKQVPKKTIK